MFFISPSAIRGCNHILASSLSEFLFCQPGRQHPAERFFCGAVSLGTSVCIALYPDAQSPLQHFVGDFCQTAYLGANCSHAWVSVSVVNNTRIVYLLLLCCHVFGKIPFFKRYYAKNGRLIPTAKSGSLKTVEHSCRVLEFCLWEMWQKRFSVF